QIARNLPWLSRRLRHIVRQLHRRPPIGLHHLAHQRNGIEPLRRDRRTAAKIIGEIGPPPETLPHPPPEMPPCPLDRLHVHPVGKDQQLRLRIAPLLLPPADDLLAPL